MSSVPTPEAHGPQPKISRRMLIRFAIGLFALAALFFGYQWWKEYSKDPDLPKTAETNGMMSALRLEGEGTHLVVIMPDGTIRPSPGFSEGKSDKDPVWRPDGNRLFFVSDREADAYQVYRWNLGSNAVMRRSVGNRSQTSPQFAPGLNDTGLLTSGGVVLEYDPKDVSTHQVLPPVIKDQKGGQEGEGTSSQFEQLYQKLGSSFRDAKWGKDKNFVAAVMRREEGGEILILQNLNPLSAPRPVIAGNRIEFDVNPVTSDVVFCVNGFFFFDEKQIPPGAIKNGKVEVPFTSIVGGFKIDGAGALYPIMPMKGPTYGFKGCLVSPDGENMLVIAGKLDNNGNFQPGELLVVPVKPEGGAQVKRLIRGQIYEPSWHPNSHTIAFCQRDEKGKRGIFTINKDGSGLTDVTKGKGDFTSPMFSPQTK